MKTYARILLTLFIGLIAIAALGCGGTKKCAPI